MTKSERKRLHDVYVRAAELIDDESTLGCCGAILLVDSVSGMCQFGVLFGRPLLRYWWPTTPQYKNVRVLALLFAAQAALTGDME